jgi:cytidine deaminase
MAMKISSRRERSRLIAKARATARRAYAPYSRFRVGAAVLTDKGVFAGTNVENASYGLGLCAERSALSAAVAAGATRFHALGVSCIDAKKAANPGELMPCGACRQWFAELAPDAEVFVDGIERSFTVDELLAFPFTLRPRRR